MTAFFLVDSWSLLFQLVISWLLLHSVSPINDSNVVGGFLHMLQAAANANAQAAQAAAL
jgi:hypothetical protein